MSFTEKPSSPDRSGQAAPILIQPLPTLARALYAGLGRSRLPWDLSVVLIRNHPFSRNEVRVAAHLVTRLPSTLHQKALLRVMVPLQQKSPTSLFTGGSDAVH